LEINDPPYAEYIDEVEVGHRVTGRSRVAFEVPNTRATTADLVDAGAELIAEPTVTPWDTLTSRCHGP
jgi:lactoylglutathione lyase